MTGFVFALTLIAILAFVVWAGKRFEKAGKTGEIAKQQGETLERVQEAQEIEREVEIMQRDAPDGALERLRRSRWNRDQ